MKDGLRQRLRYALWRPYQGIRRVLDRRIFESRYLRRPDALHSIAAAQTAGESAPDADLIDRIAVAYRRSAQRAAVGDSMWQGFFSEYHADIDAALINGPRAKLEEILRNPASSDLFYGFENLCRFLLRGQRIEDRKAPAQALDALLAFSEAIGIRRHDNPEGYRLRRPAAESADVVLAELDAALGIKLPVPNPYEGEFGLASSRGVVSYRVPQAMYQAWRIKQLTMGIPRPKILEIGGGLGRTALYANKFGIGDYTIVDIPISAVAQGYFLGRTLGQNSIALSGEPPAAVTLRTPEEFHADDTHYDLIVNVDSLTEMDRGIAEQYIAKIRSRATVFLSINHESNAFTVRELLGATGATRHPYWLRRGYVEEVARFR
jgi:hypothetical protein